MPFGVKMGYDPELLLVDGSGIGIPASKVIPDPASSDKMIVYDNASIEIRPAAGGCLEGMVMNTSDLVRGVYYLINKAKSAGNISKKATITLNPAVRLYDSDLSRPEIREFGCSPFYRMDDNIPMKTTAEVDPDEIPFRCAGFHVHCQYIRKKFKTEAEWLEYLIPRIALMDAVIGLVDVIMNAKAGFTDRAKLRRIMGYGRAGEFRVQEMITIVHEGGRIVNRFFWNKFEYRTLSPWPMSHPAWLWWAGSAVRRCVITDDGILNSINLPDRSEIVSVIQECDYQGALDLWSASIRALGSSFLTSCLSANDSLHRDNLAKLYHMIHHGDGYNYLTGSEDVGSSWERWGRTAYFPSYTTGVFKSRGHSYSHFYKEIE